MLRTLEMVKAEIEPQLTHLRWHGDTLHHWHVGVTALDGVNGEMTESVTRIYGVPVYRLMEMSRDEIRAVPMSGYSCHPPKTHPDWPERESTI